ncbi:unnamed protein product [Amoebophrya sp. A120]|nr:unnamed protein product [Amoebophrya sp. A120]|eukprot:GSA120T00025084001.1
MLQPECQICLDIMDPDDQVSQLIPCGHVFHTACIKDYESTVVTTREVRIRSPGQILPRVQHVKNPLKCPCCRAVSTHMVVPQLVDVPVLPLCGTTGSGPTTTHNENPPATTDPTTTKGGGPTGDDTSDPTAQVVCAEINTSGRSSASSGKQEADPHTVAEEPAGPSVEPAASVPAKSAAPAEQPSLQQAATRKTWDIRYPQLQPNTVCTVHGLSEDTKFNGREVVIRQFDFERQRYICEQRIIPRMEVFAPDKLADHCSCDRKNVASAGGGTTARSSRADKQRMHHMQQCVLRKQENCNPLLKVREQNLKYVRPLRYTLEEIQTLLDRAAPGDRVSIPRGDYYVQTGGVAPAEHDVQTAIAASSAGLEEHAQEHSGPGVGLASGGRERNGNSNNSEADGLSTGSRGAQLDGNISLLGQPVVLLAGDNSEERDAAATSKAYDQTASDETDSESDQPSEDEQDTWSDQDSSFLLTASTTTTEPRGEKATRYQKMTQQPATTSSTLILSSSPFSTQAPNSSSSDVSSSDLCATANSLLFLEQEFRDRNDGWSKSTEGSDASSIPEEDRDQDKDLQQPLLAKNEEDVDQRRGKPGAPTEATNRQEFVYGTTATVTATAKAKTASRQMKNSNGKNSASEKPEQRSNDVLYVSKPVVLVGRSPMPESGTVLHFPVCVKIKQSTVTSVPGVARLLEIRNLRVQAPVTIRGTRLQKCYFKNFFVTPDQGFAQNPQVLQGETRAPASLQLLNTCSQSTTRIAPSGMIVKDPSSTDRDQHDVAHDDFFSANSTRSSLASTTRFDDDHCARTPTSSDRDEHTTTNGTTPTERTPSPGINTFSSCWRRLPSSAACSPLRALLQRLLQIPRQCCPKRATDEVVLPTTRSQTTRLLPGNNSAAAADDKKEGMDDMELERQSEILFEDCYVKGGTDGLLLATSSTTLLRRVTIEETSGRGIVICGGKRNCSGGAKNRLVVQQEADELPVSKRFGISSTKVFLEDSAVLDCGTGGVVLDKQEHHRPWSKSTSTRRHMVQSDDPKVIKLGTNYLQKGPASAQQWEAASATTDNKSAVVACVSGCIETCCPCCFPGDQSVT